MQTMNFEKTKIRDLIIVSPFIAEDDRGYFMKFYEKANYNKNEIDLNVYEEMQSFSKKGVLRGLHFQTDHPQAKLVRVIHGKVYDVAVDLRAGSDTFGQWQGFELSSENKKLLYIPRGFAHGFLVLSDEAIFSYICDNKYSPEGDSGIKWNDSDLNIDWPTKEVIVSEKDARLQSFKEYVDKLKKHNL